MPVEDPHRAFYGSRMHDSFVEGVERFGDELRARLDSVVARDFSRIVSGGAPEAEMGAWPTDLVLRGVAYARAPRPDAGGRLRFLDYRSLGSGKGQTPTELLYDWFFQEDGRLQWVAQLHLHERGGPRGWNRPT
ncbi:hypothetical protein EON82_19000 [bacterium]|nr:MAG: hypothetical protein EON82_19000 [bacterium]